MRRYFITAILCLTLISCKEEENPIPIRSVYLNLDLTFKDKILRDVPSYKEYTLRDVNQALGERVGYGGVLVVHTMLNEYKAFDLACPHEAKPDVVVQVDNEVLYAVCPKCGTKYDVGFGTGAPNGVGRHYLRSYRTFLTGSKLVVN